MSISGLKDRVRTQLVDFAWSQWAQLGVSSHPSRSDRWAMDPEALILFTLGVSRRDPRLFDEMLDWISLNAKSLSLQRLRNLTSRFPVDRDFVDAMVAWVAEATPAVRWKVGRRRRGRNAKGAPVFSQDVVAFVGQADPVFERFGYLRPQAVRSGKSTGPDVRAGINLAFRLRLLFGLGTRSEVMRILLTFIDGPLDAARIADEAGFAKRNVNEALTALVTSGAIKARWSRNERVFLALRKKWATVLEIGPTAEHLPTFVSWVHLFPPLIEILSWLEQVDEAVDSEYIMSSRARDLVERIEKDLELLDLFPPSDQSLPGGAFLPQFEDSVESLLKTIAGETENDAGADLPYR